MAQGGKSSKKMALLAAIILAIGAAGIWGKDVANYLGTRGAKVERAATGTVKWYSDAKQFGFIQPDNGSDDIFVHISEVEKAKLDPLSKGQRIMYNIHTDPQSGERSATDLRLP